MTPCNSAQCGFVCKHLDNKRCDDLGLRCNPLWLSSAGGFRKALEITAIAISISGRDSSGLPTASAISSVSGEVPYAEDVFWSLVKTYIDFIRSKQTNAMIRARNQNG